MNLYQKYEKNGLKVVLTADNVDIFPMHMLLKNHYFDNIFDSLNVKYLKEEND